MDDDLKRPKLAPKVMHERMRKDSSLRDPYTTFFEEEDDPGYTSDENSEE